MNVLNNIRHLLRKTLILSIYYLRPLLGFGVCRFSISCSRYAIEQLEQKSLMQACWLIIKRLVLCTPFIPINSIETCMSNEQKKIQ